MEYNKTELKSILEISKIATVCYETHRGDSDGESHNFYELVYVDRGPVTMFLDNRSYFLEEGDILLYPPNTYHSGIAENAGKRVGIISFESRSQCLKELVEIPKKLTMEERRLFFDILRDGMPLFEAVNNGMLLKEGISVYQLQIIKNRIELLLLSILSPNRGIKKGGYQNNSAELSDKIYGFLVENVTAALNLEVLSKTFGVSVTKLKTAFKEKYKCGIIEKFIELKIDKAKAMLREDTHNVAEISELLGFSSPQYFTLQFKKRTGLTPKGYSRSIMI